MNSRNAVNKLRNLLTGDIKVKYNILIMKNIITYIKEKLNMADTAIRPKNYTDEMVASMTAQYEANPTRDTVDALAAEMGKSVRSIIAKLSREVAEHFGIALPTLVKASKADLQKLVDALSA